MFGFSRERARQIIDSYSDFRLPPPWSAHGEGGAGAR